MNLIESHLEEASLEWLDALRYSVVFGPTIAPGELLQERETFSEVVLQLRLWQAIERLNPELTADAINDVVKKVTRLQYPGLIQNNHQFHSWLIDGVPVEVKTDGGYRHLSARLVDFDDPNSND
jgi:type I restriction enzyme, R subunit